MRIDKLLAVLLEAAFLLSSCDGGKVKKAVRQGDTIALRYAEHITMVRYSDYTEVKIANPWQPETMLHTYILIPKSAQLPDKLPEGTIVRTPVKRSVVFTAPHCQLLYFLQAQQAIAGVCDLRYILNKDIHRKASAGIITDCGNAMLPSLERIIETRPEAVLISPFEGSSGYSRLEELGVPIVEAADYMETSALGRAEWMRFYGLLYGKEQQADSLFYVVDSIYHSLQNFAKKLPKGLSLLTERKTGSVWYTPGGRSTIGQLIHDAHGAYAFADDQHSGSLSLSFEQVLDKAGNTDVWAFKYTGTRPMDKRELLDEFHGYSSLKAFRTGEIYECNVSLVPLFEEVSFRPDFLLREFIQLLHPGVSLGGLKYYTKL